ncbi:hypothetical protein GH714_004643 [Hevea brasiliensis]|uniref:Leucine-rich repeat-containing N-terminal plant-type domain-containing protein n=1 Tax=Hevea brasiliensis TaxID=3981 RepID=A0A6A6KYZ9_HEVBR|nr:hypothetical protein GH714_004643 [Hevea brasiliensis]
MKGQLRESLLGLPYLSYLDLSSIDFNQMPIPEFIGSLSNLKYLDLSNANFKGIVPDHLGNLSSLQHLDLSGNSFSLKANNLDWLSGLSSLEVLDLGGVDLSNAVNWLHAINLLPSLTELSFFSCQLPILQQSLSFVNFTSLNVLDLSYNSFHSTIPKWLVESSYTLHHLNLTRCQLQGSIPDAFVNFTSLTVLDFSYNNLQGSIPHNFGNMTSLVVLDLTFNSLEELVVLEVASNSLQGLITEVHLQNFSSLRVLDLSGNQLILNMSSNWTPAFQLQTLGLNSCKLGPRFPQWLQNQTKIVNIDLSNSSISDTVPDWFWDLSPAMQILDLSFNRLGGELPDLSSKASLITLHLIENVFSGYLPHFLPTWEDTSMVGGKLTKFGSSSLRIPRCINNFQVLAEKEAEPSHGYYLYLRYAKVELKKVMWIDSQRHGLQGGIGHSWAVAALKVQCIDGEQEALLMFKEGFTSPSSRFSSWVAGEDCCKWSGVGCNNRTGHVITLDLHSFDSSGEVKGQLRESLLGLPYLSYLDLSSIDFNQVPIPEFIGSLSNLKYLDLSNANFKGIVPDHLGNLSSLQHLDLSGNSFSLKANNLDWLSGLSSLEVLDLGV